MDFIGNQTVQDPNESFGAASMKLGCSLLDSMNEINEMTRKKILMNEFKQVTNRSRVTNAHHRTEQGEHLCL